MPIVSGKYVNPGWFDNTTPDIDAAEMNAISDTLECVPIENGGTGATTAAGARNNLGLGNTSGALPIANGGTGATTEGQARNNLGFRNGVLPIALGGTNANNATAARNNLGFESGILPIALGGTGGTTAQEARTNLGFRNGILPITLGGTGATGITKTQEEGSDIVLYVFGPLVLLSYVSDLAASSIISSIPRAYAPIKNMHWTAPIYPSSGSSGGNYKNGYACCYMNTNGRIEIACYDASGPVDAYVRSEVLYLRNV